MSDKNKPQPQPQKPRPSRPEPSKGKESTRDSPIIPNHIDPNKPWPRG